MADGGDQAGAQAAEGGLSSSGEEDRSGAEDNVTLSFLDKLKCMMYSKVERDAFLIEKLEKEEKKKAKKLERDEDGPDTGGKKKKANVFDKLKSVFSSPEEQQGSLQGQVEEVEKDSRRHSADEGRSNSGDEKAVLRRDPV